MITIHAEKLQIENKFSVMISVIKLSSLILFKVIMGDRKYYISSINIRCVFYERKLHFNQRIAHNIHLH